jgi:hypothetical protein
MQARVMVADAGDVLMHNVPCMFITVHPSAAPLLPRLTSVCYNISWNVYLTTRLELTQLRREEPLLVLGSIRISCSVPNSRYTVEPPRQRSAATSSRLYISMLATRRETA